MEVLQAKNLKKIYGSGNNAVHALDGVDLSVKKGEFVAIVGTSGSGKSTLLHLFKGTQEPDSGRVTMRNGLTFGMLDQRDPLDDNATVREAALEGREDYEWAAETRSREIVEALLGGISLVA